MAIDYTMSIRTTIFLIKILKMARIILRYESNFVSEDNFVYFEIQETIATIIMNQKKKELGGNGLKSIYAELFHLNDGIFGVTKLFTRKYFY